MTPVFLSQSTGTENLLPGCTIRHQLTQRALDEVAATELQCLKMTELLYFGDLCTCHQPIWPKAFPLAIDQPEYKACP